MLEEVNAAVTFLAKLMQSSGRVTRDSVERFKHTLTGRLRSHYDGHWFPSLPHKGSGYRCLRINHIMDPLLETAARESGIPNLLRYFPNEFTLWIDPYDVSYRIGENGSIGQVYGCDSPSSGSDQYYTSQSHSHSVSPVSDLTINGHDSHGLRGMLSSCKDQLREFSAKSGHSVFTTPFAAFVSS